MARPRVFDRVDQDTIQRLKKRQIWPVALLARQLGCTRRAIEKYAAKGALDRDGRGIRTDSLLTLLKKRA